MTDRNELHELHELNQRAKSAAADLRAQAKARPVPPFDAEAPMRLATPAPSVTPSRRSLLAVAAVLALLAGGLAWWSGTRSDEPSQDRAVTTGGDVRPFVATDLPDGFESFAHTSLDPSTSVGQTAGPLLVFGPSEAEPSLGVVYLPTLSSSDIEGEEQIEIGDRTAYDVAGIGFGSAALVVDLGSRGGALFVVSPVLDRAALVQVVEGLVIDDGSEITVSDDALPPGWSLLGRDPAGFVALFPYPATQAGTGSGFAVSYSNPGEGTISIVATAGDANLASQVGLTDSPLEELTVRERPALLALSADGSATGLGDTLVLAWQEESGETIRVIGSGVTRDDLLAVAAGVEPVGQAEWSDLEEASQLGELLPQTTGLGDVGIEEIAKGRFEDGTAWRLVAFNQADDPVAPPGTGRSIQLNVALPAVAGSSAFSSSASVRASGSAFSSVTTQQRSGRRFSASLVDDQVASVELRRSDGTVPARPEIIEGAGFRAWVSELPDEPVTAVALDATGAELDTVPLRDGTATPGVSEAPAPPTTSSGQDIPGTATTGG